MYEQLMGRVPIDCHSVVGQSYDGQYTVTPVDVYAGGLESVLKQIPWPMPDEATARVMAGIMNDPRLLVVAASWTREKFDEVVENVRKQLQTARAKDQ